jgi:hypothetical protein
VKALIRASFLRDNVASLVALGADADAVRARAAHVVDAAASASTVDWLDITLDVELAEAAVATVGAQRVRGMNRALMRDALKGPLLRPIHKGALALFGRAPMRLMKFVPRGWSLVFRDAGALAWNAEAGRMELTGVPAVMLNASWLEGLAGAFEGLVEICGGTAPIVTIDMRASESAVHFAISWT